MVELWFYSGRLGNCMFSYAFSRCLAEKLKLQCNVPKGTEITGFPKISKDSILVKSHDEKYIINNYYKINPRTISRENDNMAWFIEKQFQGQKLTCFDDCITIDKVLSTPDIENKWIVTLGNFETGDQYLPFRTKLKEWFEFPEIDLNMFEFFKIDPSFGNPSFYVRTDFNGIEDNDLLISLRLEDYTYPNNIDRFLGFDYFKIILESRKWNKVYILTNPGSIGHVPDYNFIKEFFDYDPTIVRCHHPVMSMGFGAKFNNIAISQSTYSWWLGFLSDANNIYYPISKKGPFSFDDTNFKGTDLRISSPDFKYVDYYERKVLPDNYYELIDFKNKKWKD